MRRKSDMAYLIYIQGKSASVQFPIEKGGMTVGRKKENDICVDDGLVSKEHFRLEVIENDDAHDGCEYFIEDLASTNFTFVNDRKITRKKLRHNDEIRIGVTRLRFVEFEGEGYESTAIIKKSWIPGVYYTKDKKSGSK